jgi:rubrerythrin
MAHNEQLIKIFEYALNQEETGKIFYENALKKLEISSAKNAFIRLIEEEEKHVEVIKRILKGLKNGPDLELTDIEKVALKKKDFFDKQAKTNFLKQIKEESSVIDVAIFNAAWLIEKEHSEFYKKMAEQTEGEAKKALMMLSKWEESHQMLFKEFRDKMAEVFSNLS